MTPKEKAMDIFNQMCNSVDELLPLDVKECALIAVDRMINCLNDDDLYIQGESNIDGFINFYKEVKQEIKNL